MQLALWECKSNSCSINDNQIKEERSFFLLISLVCKFLLMTQIHHLFSSQRLWIPSCLFYCKKVSVVSPFLALKLFMSCTKATVNEKTKTDPNLNQEMFVSCFWQRWHCLYPFSPVSNTLPCRLPSGAWASAPAPCKSTQPAPLSQACRLLMMPTAPSKLKALLDTILPCPSRFLISSSFFHCEFTKCYSLKYSRNTLRWFSNPKRLVTITPVIVITYFLYLP